MQKMLRRTVTVGTATSRFIRSNSNGVFTLYLFFMTILVCLFVISGITGSALFVGFGVAVLVSALTGLCVAVYALRQINA